MPDPTTRGVSLIYPAPDGSYRVLQLDATLTQQHSKSVELTKFPVEDGTAASDHAILRPDSYRLDGLVTNTPIVTKEEMETGAYARRAESARDELEMIIAQKATITIETGGKVIDQMVITSLDFPRDQAGGECVRFTASMEQVVTVKTETSSLPRTKKAGIKKGGRKPTTQTDAATKKKASVATQLYDGIVGGK